MESLKQFTFRYALPDPTGATGANNNPVKPVSQPLFLTPPQAAQLAGSHPETIREALRSGLLHGEQRTKGAKWRIEKECLKAWLSNKPCQHQAANITDFNKWRQRH